MTRSATSAALIALIGILSAFLLAAPGRTVTTAFVNDLLIFLDGAHRIHWGQVPNRDFHSSLGPLVYLIPAAGYWIAGSFGTAMPVGMALVVLGFTAAAVHVLQSRLRPALAVPTGAFLIVLLAVPINLGDRISALSFAMFYNRIGWAAIALILVMYLRPAYPRKRQNLADAVCAAAMILLQLYTKVTYGAVAVAFLCLVLLDRQQRRWSALALLTVLACAAVVELLWQSTGAHIRDLLETARVSGERSASTLYLLALRNLADLVVFGLMAGLALWRNRSPRDGLFYALCVAAGLMILSQNAHTWGMVTLYAGAAVAAERAMEGRAGDLRATVSAGVPLLLLLLMLPPTLYNATALTVHFALAMGDAGRPLGLRNFGDVRYAGLWSPGNRGFSQLYVESIDKGGEVLATLGTPPERVAVLDFANPFSAGLGLRPPEGDWAWLHWGRNIDAEHHLPPERLLGDVQILMEPKIGINSRPLRNLYGAYIDLHFDLLCETQEWRAYLRRSGAG